MDANKTYRSSEATSGTFRPPLRSDGLAEPALLPVSPRSGARHTSAHHGNSKPQLPWKPRSPAPSARTSSERRGRLPHPTGSPGRPRSSPRPGSPHAGQGHPLGVREPLAPRTARAGPRSEVGRRGGFGPPPQLQPEARGGPRRPEEARLSLRGSLPWVGLGTGRRAGVGEASRAAAGETAAGKISTAARFGRKKGKLRRRGGRGEKPGSGRRKRQGERDLARCTNSREMAPESRGPRRPLSRPRLRRGG